MTDLQLELGQELRDAGVMRTTQAAADWEREAIDNALEQVIQRGQPFSANDTRPLLPAGVRPSLVGARFLAASRRGLIRRIGYTPSNEPGTHAHPIALWERA